MDWKCPECGLNNREDMAKCTCGYDANRPFRLSSQSDKTEGDISSSLKKNEKRRQGLSLKSLLLKLNGWQRLWVLVSIALLIAFVFFAYRDLPRGFDELPACNDIAHRFMEEWEKHNVDRSKTKKNFNWFYKLPPSKEMIYHGSPEFRACADKELLYQQIIFVIKVLSVWLATIAFIYGTGISVAWVISGFRRRMNNK